MGRRFMPSVLQIRYGGCKGRIQFLLNFSRNFVLFFAVGTVSVDPRLDDQPHQLIIRESMRKFTSDHDQLEICKISSPRMPLFKIISNKNIFFSSRCTLS